MKSLHRKISNLIIRYAILIAVAIPNFWIFYTLFTPLTIYPADFFLGLVYSTTSLNGNLITISDCFPIEIVGACIGASAYYLLLVLNLSTPGIPMRKRTKVLLTSFFAFWILNLARIVFLSVLFASGSPLVETLHKIFWYVFSIFLVVGIWFAEVKIFKIKEIPFYSDIKFLRRLK